MVNCYIVVGKIKLYMSLSYIKIEFYYFNYYVIIARKILLEKPYNIYKF